MRNSAWTAPTNWEEVCKRARGRANYNNRRRQQAQLRRREVLNLWHRWGGKPGLQALIAAHVGAHRSTISRDLRALGLGAQRCPTCGAWQPRRWTADD